VKREPGFHDKAGGWVQAVLGGDRGAVARAISQVERGEREPAGVAAALAAHLGRAHVLGVTGSPGAGKSTLVHALLGELLARGQRIAVVAVDPSSPITGGAVLGDRVRMGEHGAHPHVFIRSVASRGHLGGLAPTTEAMVDILDAAGFDTVIVETVGVGQSETAVAGMTDCFVLLQLPNAGDDLQAIKKGIMELADLVVFNKADLDPRAAQLAAAQMRSALSMLHPASANWQPPVLTLSAMRKEGLAEFWQVVEKFRSTLTASGEFDAKRRHQALAWMWQQIDSGLRSRFREHPGVQAALGEISASVEAGTTTPAAAAQRLLGLVSRYF